MWLIALLLILVVAIVPASYKKRLPEIKNTNVGLNVFDDFIEVSTSGSPTLYSGTYFAGAATGSAAVGQAVTTTEYPGAVILYVEDSGDLATLLSPVGALNLVVNDTLDLQTRLTLSALSTGSQVSVDSFGYSDNFTDRGSESNSAVFYYDKSVSDNWICYVKSQTNGATQSITNVPVAADTDIYLRIVIKPNFCYFYINSVLHATISNSPDASYASIGWSREKTAGTNGGSNLYIDAIAAAQAFTTPRQFANPFPQSPV